MSSFVEAEHEDKRKAVSTLSSSLQVIKSNDDFEISVMSGKLGGVPQILDPELRRELGMLLNITCGIAQCIRSSIWQQSSASHLQLHTCSTDPPSVHTKRRHGGIPLPTTSQQPTCQDNFLHLPLHHATPLPSPPHQHHHLTTPSTCHPELSTSTLVP